MALKDKVVDTAKEVNVKFDGEIDEQLSKLTQSKSSGWILVGFGAALLVIGGILFSVF